MRKTILGVATAALFTIFAGGMLTGAASALAQSASSFPPIVFNDDTPGVFILTAGSDSSYDAIAGTSSPATGPNVGGTVCRGLVANDPSFPEIKALLDAGRFAFLGDSEDEILRISPGLELETDRYEVDTTKMEAIRGLATIDDYGFLGTSNDDDANFDAGTGGSITLSAGENKIIPDGDPGTSEIFIFEDMELSGMTIRLIGDGQALSIVLDDYQVNPDVMGAADDIAIAIDLDLVPFDGRWVTEIVITDDNTLTSPPGRSDCDRIQYENVIDTSVEIDAVAVMANVLIPRSAPLYAFPDDTPGVFVYTAGTDSSYDMITGVSSPDTGPNPGGTTCTGQAGEDPSVQAIANLLADRQFYFLGDTADEVSAIQPGADLETDDGSAVDLTVGAAVQGLRFVDDYGFLGNTGDDASNFDAGTGGSITLNSGADTIIVADGTVGRAEISIFEDAELSGMTIELRGDGESLIITLDDYQVNPDVTTAADDILIAIDLDSTPFVGRWVDEIVITDDNVPTLPAGRSDCDPSQTENNIDTSLELDAVAIRVGALVDKHFDVVTLPGRSDGWFRVGVTRNWVSPACRSQLIAAGAPLTEVSWPALAQLADATPFERCGELLTSLPPVAQSRIVTLAGRNDGWVERDGTRNWVSSTCRTELENAGLPVQEVPWSTLSQLVDASPFQRCDALLADAYYDSSNPRMITLAGRIDGWIQVGQTRNWVSAACRSQFLLRGFAVQQVPWSTLSPLFDASPFQRCDALLADVFG